MNQEKIVLSIIKGTGLSREEIKEMVEKKVATLKGISIQEALLIITKDLAVNITECHKPEPYDSPFNTTHSCY